MNKGNKEIPFSTKEIVKGLWESIRKKRKKQLFALIVVMLISGFFEMILIGSLVPYIGLLTDGDNGLNNKYVLIINSLFNINSLEESILFCSIILILISLVTCFIRIFNQWFSLKFSAAVGNDLSKEVFYKTIYQPYKNHINKNSSNLITTVSNEISLTVVVIDSIIIGITSSIIISFILAAMLISNWKTAVFSGIFFLISYRLILNKSNEKLVQYSKVRNFALKSQIKSLQESIGSIRDVILDNSQEIHIDEYNSHDIKIRRSVANSQLIKTLPRFIFEAIMIIILAILSAAFVYKNGLNSSKLLSTITVLAVGAQKLLPAFQQIYGGWGNIRNCSESVRSVLKLLRQPIIQSRNFKDTNQIKFKKEITFENVYFSYKENSPNVLNNINLKIKKGEHIGITGITGSGKSTLLDLIMGLLTPSSGSIFIDNIKINNGAKPELIRKWRREISHVPQNIFLMDNSIKNNIAMGVKNNEINFIKLKDVSQKAQIANFIENSKYGFDKFVGERGINLSGGQKQRIGIARALYRDFSVLVLDEATSALDTETESNIINNIYKSDKNITIISVAHRKKTLKYCDRIFELKNGSLINANQIN